jgi:hypothetical protein
MITGPSSATGSSSCTSRPQNFWKPSETCGEGAAPRASITAPASIVSPEARRTEVGVTSTISAPNRIRSRRRGARAAWKRSEGTQR